MKHDGIHPLAQSAAGSPIRGVVDLVINIKPYFISSLNSTCLVSAAGLPQQCKDMTDITAVLCNTSVMPILFVTLKFSLDSNEPAVALLSELHFEDSLFHFACRRTGRMTTRRDSLTLPLMPRCQMSDRPPAVSDCSICAIRRHNPRSPG